MAKRRYGKTRGGKPIDDQLVEKLVERAEQGYDVDASLRRRGGRPPLGSAPATVVPVRLDPELRGAVNERARRDHVTASAVIRSALRSYLNPG